MRRAVEQHRPAAVLTRNYRLAEHTANQGPAAAAAAGASADAGALADLLKSLGAGLDGFDHRALANLVAQASWLEVLDDRLFACLLFEFVDSGYLSVSTKSESA